MGIARVLPKVGFIRADPELDACAAAGFALTLIGRRADTFNTHSCYEKSGARSL
jgi:hypothetical protein